MIRRTLAPGLLVALGLGGPVAAGDEVVDASALGVAPGRAALGGDPVLAVVDGDEVRADDLLPFLFLTRTEHVFAALEQEVRRRLVAKEAASLGVTVPRPTVDEKVRQVLKAQDDDFRLQAGPDRSFEEYIRDRYGVDPAVYRRCVEQQVVHELMLARVVRYDLRRQERLQVRILVVDDVAVARDVLDKLAEGANFAALAKQVSVDRSAARGGLFPPVGVDCPHPLLAGARDLAEKEIAEISTVERGGTRLFRVLKLEKRFPPDPRPFAEQAAEVEAELEERPLDPFEALEWDRRARERHRIEVRMGRA